MPVSPDNPTSAPAPTTKFTPAKLATIFALVVTIGYVIFDSLTSKHIPSVIGKLQDWIAENPEWGVFANALVYAIATVAFVPGSLLTVASGFAFASATNSPGLGTLLGSISVFVGASVGSIAAFLLARYMFRNAVAEYLQAQSGTGFTKYWAAIDRAMGVAGLKVMFLLRLSPLIPFNALNYVAGTTAISLRDYCVSMLGILPGTVLFVYIGATAKSLSDAGDDESSVLKTVFLVCGVALGFVGVFIASYFAKKELDKELGEAAHDDLLQGSVAVNASETVGEV
jgi:uncharacterized membrane protein YdjX (TVP38/TMEM64 family)